MLNFIYHSKWLFFLQLWSSGRSFDYVFFPAVQSSTKIDGDCCHLASSVEIAPIFSLIVLLSAGLLFLLPLPLCMYVCTYLVSGQLRSEKVGGTMISPEWLWHNEEEEERKKQISLTRTYKARKLIQLKQLFLLLPIPTLALALLVYEPPLSAKAAADQNYFAS